MLSTHEIEKKWQNYWDDHKSFMAVNGSDKEKYYYLIEFPYPSGSGLHVGHVRSYTALDTMARKKRMMGYNVLFPIGWDAFGAPAEQYAVKNRIHPSKAVEENIKVFKKQVKDIGISFDWSREFSTTDPDYYKWTQWQFLKFFEHDMAYKAKKNINWCPSCKTGLSNEDSSGGVCERCGTQVVQKQKEQWMLRMSDYAEQLLQGLDDTKLMERIKTAQINWIGKSVGAELDFKIKQTSDNLRVFTTRPDTIYGATFMVIAPEHPLIDERQAIITNMEEVRRYRSEANTRTEFERTQMTKDKTGVRLDGLTAINPATDKEIPIFISDYVMMGYGTGAIMGVPSGDQRDWEFATKFGIEIIEVIQGGDMKQGAYTGDGIMVNSGPLNGIDNKKEAIDKIMEILTVKQLGQNKINYKLMDWVYSRQRFWGEPIPLIYCDDHGWVAVPDEELPVTLPMVAEFEPTEDAESPLAKITDWVNAPCPKCGKMGRRETDTMPNWAGSSWYFLRYMDPHNDKEFVSQDALNYWGQVDWYNGGMEHATRHLLYARFWNQFLYNIGLVPHKEPFIIRSFHGMILGQDGEKMSKSKGNVVNPDDMIKKYGADTLRAYELFIGDYEKEVAWNENGLNGCRRFLDRVIKIGDKLTGDTGFSKNTEKLFHRTIKKVTEDIDSLKFNTAIASLMILMNELDKQDHISKKDYRTLLLLLNPTAPHITEELNEVYGLGKPLCDSEWPTYREDMLLEDEKEIAVQINGKVRTTINVNINDSEDIMKEKAMAEKAVKKYTDGKQIVQTIVITGQSVNIVVK